MFWQQTVSISVKTILSGEPKGEWFMHASCFFLITLCFTCGWFISYVLCSLCFEHIISTLLHRAWPLQLSCVACGLHIIFLMLCHTTCHGWWLISHVLLLLSIYFIFYTHLGICIYGWLLGHHGGSRTLTMSYHDDYKGDYKPPDLVTTWEVLYWHDLGRFVLISTYFLA